MSRVFWDTNLFVYWLENRPHYADRIRQIFSAMEQRRDELCASSLAVGEVLAGAYRGSDTQLPEQCKQFFRDHVTVVSFDANAADRFARIRALHNVSPADAVHLACAGEIGTDLFLTNDKALLKRSFPGIQFIDNLDTHLF